MSDSLEIFIDRLEKSVQFIWLKIIGWKKVCIQMVSY